MPIYILATFFTQLSVISLNFRITQRALFPVLWWIVRITLWQWVIWLPSTMADYLLQCLPIEANYKLHLRFEATTKCKDYVPVYIVMAFAHTLVDFAILSVPVYLVLKAQVSRRKKRAALVFSGIGFVAALFSIVRASFAVLYSRSSDMAFIASWIAYSSQFELALAVIATSLPKLRWLVPCSDRSGPRFTFTGNTGPGSRELATVAPSSPHSGSSCKDIELGDGLTRDDIQLVPS
ncbi:hypothetical protein NM208_g11224 [Fusarium decemcellulare]|uniref:Uncharacterized protein n=1 Tax=Fusarium decemcellulare TaxID=57161 RepID=A0ACC1RV33_9HYPO|nr:hypothetical protein NM208_g11224 [Fusarium decemcellulare]